MIGRHEPESEAPPERLLARRWECARLRCDRHAARHVGGAGGPTGRCG